MSSVVKGVFGGGDSSKDAAKVQAASSKEAVEEQRRQFDITQENLQPFLDAGTGALSQQEALLGLSGVPEQRAAFDAFASSPGQQFLQERGHRALVRNASSLGGLGGGNVRSALQQQGIGFAQQDFGNQFSRLAGLSGTGQATGTQLGQLGAQTAAGIGSSLQAAGQARASGILGAQQANAALGGQVLGAGGGALVGSLLSGSSGILGGLGAGGGALLGLLSDIRFKKNIEKIGELESGLGWYIWDWTEEGEMLSGGQDAEGVIAQEVLYKIPDAVTDAGGFLVVDYRRVH